MIINKRLIVYSIMASGLILSTRYGYCNGRYTPGNDKKSFPSCFQGNLKVDGNPAEWPSKVFYNNNEANVLYAVANDSTHVFFCLEILDRSTQMAVLHEGINLWVDPSGKKKETCSLGLTARPFLPDDKDKPSPEEGRSFNPPPGKTSAPGSKPPDLNRKNPVLKPQRFTGEMKLGGFRENFNGVRAFDSNDKGFQVAIAYDTQGGLIIEGRIPLQAFRTDPKLSKCLCLGFKVETVGESAGGEPLGEMRGENPRHGQQGGADMAGGMQGQGPGGRSGMDGGGKPSGGGFGDSPDRTNFQNQSKSIRIWHKFSLAPAP